MAKESLVYAQSLSSIKIAFTRNEYLTRSKTVRLILVAYHYPPFYFASSYLIFRITFLSYSVDVTQLQIIVFLFLPSFAFLFTIYIPPINIISAQIATKEMCRQFLLNKSLLCFLGLIKCQEKSHNGIQWIIAS